MGSDFFHLLPSIMTQSSPMNSGETSAKSRFNISPLTQESPFKPGFCWQRACVLALT